VDGAVSWNIIDTNLWISFLIGKELQNLRNLIVNERIKPITTDQLIHELKIVTSREKLKKYFDQDKVSELISLLDIVSDKVKIKKMSQFAVILRTIFCLLFAKKAKQIF
jgi:putative PIN family toxin of toxin-antitoxin system